MSKLNSSMLLLTLLLSGCHKEQQSNTSSQQSLVFRDVSRNEASMFAPPSKSSASESSKFIEQFLSTITLEERLARTADPDVARQFLGASWSGPSLAHPIRISDGVVKTFHSPDGRATQRTVVYADFQNRFGGVGTFAYVLRSGKGGFKIDATETYGLGVMTYTQFINEHPSSPIVFRVIAKLGDDYDYEFSPGSLGDYGPNVRDRFYAVDMENPDAGFVSAYTTGYLDKNNQTAKMLYELLKDGQKHAITIKLIYSDALRHPGQICVIDSFVKDGWIQDS